MPTRIDSAYVELTARDQGLEASLKLVANRLSELDSRGTRNLDNLDRALSRVRNSVLSMAAVWGAWRVGKGIVDAGVQMQSLTAKMGAATGNAQIAAEAMAFVRSEADRLGLDVRSTADGFASFSASALRAGLTFSEVQQIFTGVSEASAGMRLSTERTQLVFMALSQMASKGKVSMEELRQQLGESLPGALQVFSKAMGVGNDEFIKMVENGQVTTRDLIKLGDGLRNEFGAAAEEASKGAQAAFNRMGNAFFELQSKMADSGFLDAVTNSVETLTETLNDSDTIEGLKGFASLLGDITNAATKAASAIGRFYAEGQQRKQDLLDATEGQPLFVTKGVGLGSRPALNKFNAFDALDDAAKTRDLRDRVLADFEAKQKAVAKERAASPKPASANYTLGALSAQGQNSAQRDAEEKAQRLRDQLSSRVDSINLSNARETDPARAATMELQKQEEVLRQALEAKAITEQEFRDASLQAEVAYQDELKTIREQTWQENQSALESFLGVRLRTEQQMNEASIAEQASSFAKSISMAAKNNQVFFAIEKARAIAAALISARESVVHAYNFGSRTGGPPLGAAFAGIAAAAQAANIAAIASTQFNGGSGSVGRSAGGGGTTESSGEPTGTMNSATSPSKSIYITLNGDEAFYSKNQIRKLLEGINDALGDGSQLKVTVSS